MAPLQIAIAKFLLCLGLAQQYVQAKLLAGYNPSFEVADHANIDLDQQLLQSLLNQQNFSHASLVYNNGAHSKSYANITLQESTGRINANMAFSGTTISGEPVVLYAYSDYPAGETSIKLRYATGATQATSCHVGANPTPVVDGCLTATGTIQLDGIHSKPLQYTYDPYLDNLNGRTLAGFSKNAEELMAKCDSCPYRDYNKYLTYYGMYDYAHELVTAALEQRSTNFDSGNIDFGLYSIPALQTTIALATRNLNLWMYVVREFEDAIDDCNKGCASDQCNTDKVNAWDEGIAFYTGSLEGPDGSGDGVLSYALADELCVEFKTCGEAGDEIVGTSYVNQRVIQLSRQAVELLMAEECQETRDYVTEVVGYMTVPLVQGLLKASYESSRRNRSEEELDVAKAEAAAFAASVVPILHHCSAKDAAFVQKQLDYGEKNRDFIAIKETLERHYECMGITCEQVGGLWNPKNDAYREGAGPCASEKKSSSKVGLALGVTVGVVLVLSCVAYCFRKVTSKKEESLGEKSTQNTS